MLHISPILLSSQHSVFCQIGGSGCSINKRNIVLTIQLNRYYYFNSFSFSFSFLTRQSFTPFLKGSHSCTSHSIASFHSFHILLNRDNDNACISRRTWLLNAAITPISDVETFRVVDANSSLHVCTVFSICIQWEWGYYVVYEEDWDDAT